MRIVPLLGCTEVLAAAVRVMFAGPTIDNPDTDSQSSELITFHPTMLPVLTPTVSDPPAASNSYSSTVSDATAASWLISKRFAATALSAAVTVIVPERG